MPLPILPFLGKVVMGGIALGVGNDLYAYGKEKIQENTPLVKEGLGEVKEGLSGVWDKVTDVLDPLDLFGQQAAREEKQKSEAAGAAKKSAEAKAKEKAKAVAEQHAAELSAIRQDASKRIADIESKAKRDVQAAQLALKTGTASVKAKAAKELKSAKDALKNCQAMRAADKKSQSAPTPELTDFLYAAYDAVKQGAPLPSAEEYTPYGIDAFYEESAIPVGNQSPWEGAL